MQTINTNDSGADSLTKINANFASIPTGSLLSNLADGQGTNYQIVSSIATSDLTVAIKTQAGTDATALDKATFSVANEQLELESALSVTITDALGDIFDWDSRKIQGNDAQVFVYIINNNGTLQLGLSPCPTLTTVATNFYDAGGQTGSAGHYNIVMSGTRNATNFCRVIGRVSVHQNDDNTWQSATIANVVNSPIYETDQMDWTPVLTSGASDLSGYTSAKYKILNNLLQISFSANTKNMTGAGVSAITSPVPPTISEQPLNAVIYNGTSYNWTVCWTYVTGTSIRFWKSAATTWAGGETGVIVYITGIINI